MSIKVSPTDLGSALGEHDFGYLLSPGRDRPHVGAVIPQLVDGGLVIESPGPSAVKLAAEHPEVTLLFPPRAAGGYSLIVDGLATSSPDGSLAVAVEHAVLHRPAVPGGPTSATGCGQDCAPVT